MSFRIDAPCVGDMVYSTLGSSMGVGIVVRLNDGFSDVFSWQYLRVYWALSGAITTIHRYYIYQRCEGSDPDHP